MNKPHKHAEVLRAIADGKQVQWSSPETCDGCWHDLDVDLFNPLANAVLKWRVKPEPKPDVVKYLNLDKSSHGDNQCYISNEPHRHWQISIKLVLDGETNEPKSVELVK